MKVVERLSCGLELEDADLGLSDFGRLCAMCRLDDHILKTCANNMVDTATIIVPTIQIMKFLRLRRCSNCCRLWAGSPMAPKVAMSAAPEHVKTVPKREKRVNGSPSNRVANAVLNTSPEACRVDRTGRGKVVICMVLPTRFEMTNMNIPNCHFRLL